MAMQRNEVTEGAYFAQYIGCNPALQVFRDRGNQEPVRVQVVLQKDGTWMLVLPYLPIPSAHNPQELESVFRDWRFLRRVKLSVRCKALDVTLPKKNERSASDSRMESALTGVDA
jgi:hypothetical protein